MDSELLDIPNKFVNSGYGNWWLWRSGSSSVSTTLLLAMINLRKVISLVCKIPSKL